MDKVFFAGTHRVRQPQETLDIITPLFPGFGVTRLADVTGLDVLGIPVVMAVRPLATTLSVSQGKGASLLLAKVSGAMEAIEIWHAENAVPPPVLTGVPAAELDIGYQVADLDNAYHLVSERTRLDWIQARGAASGEPVLVPRQSVEMRWRERDDWRNCLLSQDSNGLASGNTHAEALTHALYEVIERDCTSTVGDTPLAQRVHIAPSTVDDSDCRELVERIERAKAWLEIVYVPNRWSLPCFVAYVWHEDLPVCLGTGSGAHSDPSVALSRAITEAAQSRLTFISGTRDDLEPRVYQRSGSSFVRPVTSGKRVAWKEVADRYNLSFATDDAEATWLARNVASLSGCEPMVADLSVCDEIAVVKVVCPGLRFTGRHDIPRLEAEAAR
jgi:ribosomal protein S12 methylthiotransferase accessory factor